jgi:hypothetical protein
MLYPGQALLPDRYIYIEVTLNQETMPAVRLLRWQSEPELVTVPAPSPAPARCWSKWKPPGYATATCRRLRRGEVRGRAVVTPGAGQSPDVASVAVPVNRHNLSVTGA